MPPVSWPLKLLPTALLLGGCLDGTTTTLVPCDVVLEELKPAAAEPGASVVLFGHPFSTAYDTAVYVDAIRAEVVAVERFGCDACDDCTGETADCTRCNDCDDCDAACEECLEAVAFLVPEAAGPGAVRVTLYNRYGESGTLLLEVTAPPEDTGGADTGVVDTGDTGAGETGDTGSEETGDTGPVDTGDTAAAEAAP